MGRFFLGLVRSIDCTDRPDYLSGTGFRTNAATEPRMRIEDHIQGISTREVLG